VCIMQACASEVAAHERPQRVPRQEGMPRRSSCLVRETEVRHRRYRVMVNLPWFAESTGWDTDPDAFLNVSPASAPCPRCDKRGSMQWQWKPDLTPERERLRCYSCGWDTDWIRYGTCRVRYVSK